MASKAGKIFLGLVAAGAVTAITLGVASAAPKKKTPLDENTDDDSPEVLPDEEIETGDEDVVIVPPGPDGTPGTGPQIVVETDDQGEPTPVDEKLEELAAEEGKTPSEAVSEVVKDVTGDQGLSPIGQEELKPSNDPFGTIALARKLLSRETMPGWKSDLTEEIAVWQQVTGDAGPVDGLFGIKGAARMAKEVGLLPLIRYWPKSVTTKKQAEKLYDQTIGAIIANDLEPMKPDSQAQIDALIRSMQREQAQSFGAKDPKPQPTLEFAQIVTDEIATKAEKGSL